MSTAICTHCAMGRSVSLGRGVKLAELRCKCGAKLTMAKWTERGYVPRSEHEAGMLRIHMQNVNHQWDGYAKEESFGEKNY